MKYKKIVFILLFSLTVFTSNSALAGYVHDTEWDPPNVTVDENHPYYFPMVLPSWDYEKDDYGEATFELTYLDQCSLDIFIYAADPSTDTSLASNYNILLGTVPYETSDASGTATFDLLAALDAGDFNALFMGQSLLYVVADCHYVFDKAALHLEAVPIPTTVMLFASGLIGLIGLRRRRKH